jgi:hypothetical protein
MPGWSGARGRKQRSVALVGHEGEDGVEYEAGTFLGSGIDASGMAGWKWTDKSNYGPALLFEHTCNFLLYDSYQMVLKFTSWVEYKLIYEGHQTPYMIFSSYNS